MKLMKENEERLAMRKQQDKEREKHDFLMMEQYKAMLEREEKKREESLMAMYAKARQRAQAIGEDVLAQVRKFSLLDILNVSAYNEEAYFMLDLNKSPSLTLSFLTSYFVFSRRQPRQN